MATIKDSSIIREMIESGGSYRGDIVPFSIIEYYQMNQRHWSVCYDLITETSTYTSPWVDRPRKIWSAEEGWLLKQTIEEYFK